MNPIKDANLLTKKKRLQRLLEKIGSLAVAFSGGVDSTFLLAMAQEALAGNAIAVTSESVTHPAWERRGAETLAKRIGVRHFRFHSAEMDLPAFLSNDRNRCYICKKSLFAEIRKIAAKEGIRHISHGANLDDLGDFRPGFIAAREEGVLAPLVDAGLSKTEIRLLAKEMGLPNWNKPPMACLASRIPYGDPITHRALFMIEQAEAFLLGSGFSICRVRRLGSAARIEVDSQEVDRLLKDPFRDQLVMHLQQIGFSGISVDLEGYRQGSMNETNRIIKELKLVS